MISSVAWVPRGAARRLPQRQEMSMEEFEAIKAAAEEEAGDDVGMGDDADAAGGEEEGGSSSSGAAPKAKASAASKSNAGAAPERGQMMGDDEDDEEDNAEEAEDLEARPHDAFVVVANTEDEYSSLEVHVYNEADGTLYVHHDVTLPSFPLCLAWSDYAGDAAGSLYAATGAWDGEPSKYVGSYCAVGSFEPDIEIWNLDIIDPLEPTLVLRGNKAGKAAAAASGPGKKAGGKKKKGGKKGGKKGARSDDDDEDDEDDEDEEGGASASSAPASSPDGHEDAVMGVSWNRTHRNMLVSSSADTTVKVWDLNGGGRHLHTFRHHKGKVQAVAWNPAEATVLASASYDRTVAVVDARDAASGRTARYALPGDPESLQWNHLAPATFLVSTDSGHIVSFDVRTPDKPLWTLKAHEQSVTSMSLSATAAGLLATSSIDKTVKLWDLNGAGTGAGAGAAAPTLVGKKAMSIGQIFTCSFFSGNPYLLACGGSKGMLAIWDVSEDGGDAAASGSGAAPAAANAVTERFKSRVRDPATIPSLAIRQRADGQPV
jgi:periodic tryptophan protein 1